MKKAFFNTLYKLASQDSRIVLVKADMGYVPEYQNNFPKQYVDVGIAEQNMIGVAAGMAMEGYIPFTYTGANFATIRCLEQIRHDIAYHKVNVKIVSGGVGFDHGALGATHHATEDLAIMRAVPNLKIFSPCDAQETVAVTNAAYEVDGPCFIRNGLGGETILHKKPLENFRIGKALPLLKGTDVAILATGSIVEDAMKAAKALQGEGYSIGVYSFPTIKPLDKELILELTDTVKLIITLEEHTTIGGFGSAVAEVVSEVPGRAKLRRIGIPDTFATVVGSKAFLKKMYGVDSNAVADMIQRNIN